MKQFEFYKDFFSNIKLYWRGYKGWGALARSPYLHLAIVFSLLMFPYWEKEWWQIALTVISNLLGFSVGGYAIWLAIGEQGFTDKLAGPGRDKDNPSPYIIINATFVHFVFVQVLAMLAALLFQAWVPEPIDAEMPIQMWTAIWFLSAAGYTLFLYALFMALAAAFTIFRISRWYDHFISVSREHNDGK